jgi:hypothetical protein
MKRQILTLTGMLALISSAATTLTADYASTVSNLKPVAFWRLNESTQPPAADVAVNAGSLSDSAVGYYLGTAQHPVPGALTGRTDSAVGFDATANSVTMIPYMPEMNPKAPFTVEAWLSPNVEHAAGSGTLTCAISSGQFASPRTGWLIYQAENGWNLRMYDNKGAATSVNITGGTAPVSGQWYHVVAVYDGATAKLFVNGAKAAEAAQTSYVPGQSGGFAIGGRADGSFWWNGSADEVALYSKALTDDEISGHYANGSATNPSASYQSLVLAKSPLAYYRLNEAAYTAPTSLPVAANVGSAGASIAGSYNPGMQAAADGPKPPIYTGFEASNGGGGFNGSAGYVGTPFQMNDMSEFTMMGWIRRGAIKSGRGGYFGQNDLLEFGDADAGANIELWVNARGGNIKAAYPFKDNEWGHFAVIGDASSTVLYANGKEIGRLSGPLASYGTSSFNFNIGGGGIFNTAGDYFRGNIDEVAVFDKALTATAIQAIYFSANVAPTITLQPTLPSRTLYAGYSVSLTGAGSGTPPLTYQWRKDGQNLSGKTSPTLSLTGVTAADVGSYELVVSSTYGSVSSSPVALVVTPADAVAPTLQYAAGLSSFDKVRLWFSEPLDPTTAQIAANYKIDGLTVTAATLVSPPGTIGDNIVELTTTQQTAGQTYTVSVSRVQDQMLPATTIEANSTITFGSWLLASGALRFEHYDNLPTASDAAITAALADSRVIAGTPTTLGTITGRFDTRTVFPDDSHENYMARITGFITPTESGDYYFFLASDDASRVYLSQNETSPNPATDTPIINEPGCCNGFYEPETGDPATTAAPISLQAGKRYAILTLLKEGGGGDWLKVAWRKSTDTTAAASLPPIEGKFLSTFVDPNAEVEFTKQPTNQEGALSTTAVNFLTQAFTSSDGGFTVTNTTPEPPGPWVYDPANGLWSADGSVDECGGPYNSRLNSGTYTVPESQAVTLSFSHRYSFEGDLYDGGQVLVSVNGGAFTSVPAENFTANGYANGVIQGNGVLKGLRAFNADSAGYAAGEFITSAAILGTFTKGDKIVVQFLGGWDDCSKASTPSWQIKEVKLAVSSPPTAVTFEGAAKVTRQGVATSFSYQWQRNDGAGFVDIANATGTSYRFFPTTPSDISASYRLLAGVPGKLAPSTAVRVTAPAPVLSLSRTGDVITVNFTGKLQSSTSISGPFSNVTGATSPYTVPAPSGGSLFYRSIR